jgi:hypothetical protein
MKSLSVVVLAVALLIAAGTNASAQKQKKGEQRQDAKIQGTIEGVQNGMLLVKSQDKNWYVMLAAPTKTKTGVEPGTEIAIAGTTGPEALVIGAFVEFKADIDGKKMTAKEPVAEFKVFTPQQGQQAGIASDEAPAVEAPEEGSKKRPAKAVAVPDGMATVIGRVASVRNGKMQLQVGGKKPLTVEVAETAQVTVDTTNLAMAHRGDEVTADGWYTKEGQLHAKRVDVKLVARAVAAPTKKRGAKPKLPASDPAATEPKADAADPATEKPAADKPAAEKPAAEKPATKKASAAGAKGKKAAADEAKDEKTPE